jgi:hypothetical protein
MSGLLVSFGVQDGDPVEFVTKNSRAIFILAMHPKNL